MVEAVQALDLLTLRYGCSAACSDVKARATEKIADIEEKIHDLNRIRSLLTGLVEQCGATTKTSECTILDALDDGNDWPIDER